MSKFSDFFRPQRLGFHLVLAFVITIVLILIVRISLTAYTHHGDEVEIRNYCGMKADDLINGDSDDGFVFVIGNTVYNKDCPDGTVLEQDPKPGDKVKKGRKVYLTCSSIVPPKVAMPQLADNVTLRQAKTILENSGLQLGDVIYEESESVGLVLEQFDKKGHTIPAKKMINVGDVIVLKVGTQVQRVQDDLEDESAIEDENFDD